MDERTRRKHLNAIKYGLRYFEGHIADAVKHGVGPASIMADMIQSATILGAWAIEREAYAKGVNKKDELADRPRFKKHAFLDDAIENVNCEFEPQLASGWDFPNIGRGVPKENAA